MKLFLKIVAALAAIAVIGAVGFFTLLPEHRPPLKAGERYGIDVSSHQGAINWSAVAKDNVDFAYIKATEGGTFVDSKFQTNWDGAARAGLQRGGYHFYTFCASVDDQARNFLQTVPRDDQALAPAVDLELAGNCKTRPSQEDVQRDVTAFVTKIEESTGRQALLYVGDDFEGRYHVKSWLDRTHWQPRFMRRPGGEKWTVWQFTGFAHVNGVKGRVDLNVGR